MIGRTSDIEIREAVLDCLSYERQSDPDARLDAFLHRLERHNLAIVPIGIRRNASLFGIGMLARMEDGMYEVLDPVRYKISEVDAEV